MSVNIDLKDETWSGINKMRVPLDGGGTQDFSIGGGSANLQTKSKTYTPTTSQQTDTILPDTGYDGMDEVDITVNAVPSATASSSGIDSEYTLPASMRKWRARGQIDYGTGGYVSGVQYGDYVLYNAVPTGTTVTPTESSQTIGGADYMMEGAVTVNAIPSNYVGSGITRRDDDDIQGIEDDPYYTVYVPAGYYQNSAQHDAPIGTEGTPTATKGAVSNHSVSVTPSVTNGRGYITGSTKTGTAVTVSAIELVSGTKSITSNGTGIDVTEYASVDVNVSGGSPNLQTKSKTYTPTTSQQTEQITADAGYDGLDEVDITVDAMPTGKVLSQSGITTSGTITAGSGYITVSGSANTTPNVVTAGYISEGTQTMTSMTLRANVTTKGATTYTPTASDQTISGSTYLTGTQTIEGIVCSNLTASNIKKDVVVKIGTATDDDSVTTITGTYSGGGGASNFVLLGTKDCGTVSTSSTTAATINKDFTVSGVQDYDLLVVETSVNTKTNNRHASTSRLIWLSNSSNISTKNSSAIANVTWNCKMSSTGVGTTRTSTTPRGVYPNSCSVSTTNGVTTASIVMYSCYNSTQTGTINGTYTARVYGVKLYDLIGG